MMKSSVFVLSFSCIHSIQIPSVILKCIGFIPGLPNIKLDTTRSFCSQINAVGSGLDSSAMSASKTKLKNPQNLDAFDVKEISGNSKPQTIPESVSEWVLKIYQSMFVYQDFVSEDEEVTLMKEIEPFISRLHYEESHWDDAIHSYRETERSVWNKSNTVIFNRIRQIGFPPPVRQLKLVHVLDLAKNGVIKPHIDSIRFCGSTIAGLSLLSDSIMRLCPEDEKIFACDVLLPRRSLYVMDGFTRYKCTHQILGQSDSLFKKTPVPRDRRISIMCRNEPEESPDQIFQPILSPEKT